MWTTKHIKPSRVFQNITSLNLNLDLIHTITPAADPDATLVPVVCLPWVSEEPNLKVDRVVRRGLGWVCGGGGGRPSHGHGGRQSVATDTGVRRHCWACCCALLRSIQRVCRPPTLRPARRSSDPAHGDEWTRTINARLTLRVINYVKPCRLLFINNIIIIKTQFKGSL